MQVADVQTQNIPLGPSVVRTTRDICISEEQVGHAVSLPLPFFLLAIFDGRFVAIFFISYNTDSLDFQNPETLSRSGSLSKHFNRVNQILTLVCKVARTGFEPVLPA